MVRTVLVTIFLFATSILSAESNPDRASLTEQFIYWVEQKDYAQAKSFLDQGVDVNAENRFGMSALAWAARNDDLDGMKKLMDWGAEPKLEHQMLLCPREGFSEALKFYLADNIDLCRCSPPATVRCEGSEGLYDRWCESKDSDQKDGLYIRGRADGCGFFFQIDEATFFQNGQVAQRWKRDHQSRAFKKITVSSDAAQPAAAPDAARR